MEKGTFCFLPASSHYGWQVYLSTAEAIHWYQKLVFVLFCFVLLLSWASFLKDVFSLTLGAPISLPIFILAKFPFKCFSAFIEIPGLLPVTKERLAILPGCFTPGNPGYNY
jgi:hypothetical protein